MKLDYKYNNLYELLEKNSLQAPKKIVIYSESGKLTNIELQNKVDRLARFLENSGIKFGDKVAIVMSNSHEFVISLFAICKIGAIAVPINNFLKSEELEYIIKDCQAKLLVASNSFKSELKTVLQNTTVSKIIWTQHKDELDEFNFCFDEILSTIVVHEHISHSPALNDTAIIIYTSGTTGNPKGAMLSYKNIFSNSIAGGDRFKLTSKDRFVVYLPMFHSFTPQIYNALNKAKIPWYFMWFNNIRLFVSGSAPLSEQVLIDFNKKFKKSVMIEGYGLSECSPAVSSNLFDKRKTLSVGVPFKSFQVKIVDDELLEVPKGDVGEIIVYGDCVMQGYYNNPTATDNTIINGWLKTGDLGYVDDDGFIYIVDRKKDLIISKGINVYPREIEELIIKIDGIDAVAVVGIKDETKDERIVAFVELEKEKKHKISEHSIKEDIKPHLANFKMPKHIYFIEELPKNAASKVLKRKLKENIKMYIDDEK